MSRSRSATPDGPSIPQPDHFYGAEPRSPDSDDPEWLDPDDDPKAARGIPVFKPTIQEFENFEKYMESIERWGQASGIVKIIPPKEWSAALPNVKPVLPSVRLRNPIEQRMQGRGGLFRQQNIEKRRVMTLREWVEMSSMDDMRAPSAQDGSRKLGASSTESRRTRSRSNRMENDQSWADSDGDASEAPTLEVEDEGTIVASGGESKSPPDTAVDSSDRALSEPASKSSSESVKEAKDPRDATRAALDEAFLKTFEPSVDWLPPNTFPEDYTPEYCRTLERLYWRNCGIGKPAWYGADMAGSLFTDETKEWNVAKLESCLTRLLPPGAVMPGVNTPYLYFGMWRATFAWHVEDMDLFSINYIHWGAPKFWYAIPQARATAMEGVMKSYFPEDNNQCPQFLRHKSYLVSPTKLSQSSCKPNILVQHAGEFVVTFPRGYHAGFNLGLNCAESVNFALESWTDLGKKARVCECVPDSVHINVKQLLRDRGLEQDEPENSSPDQLSPVRKRKGEDLTVEGSTKKVKRNPSSASKAVPGDLIPPCCFCASSSVEGLLRVHSTPQVAPTVVLPDVLRAHEACALIITETWIDEVDLPDGGKEKVIFGIDSISQDNWNVKCVGCTRHLMKSHGVPVKCSHGRCLRAYHISCAMEEKCGSAYRQLQEVERDVVLVDGLRMIRKLGPPDPLGIHPAIQMFPVPSPPDQITLSQPPQFVKKTTKRMVEILCGLHNPVNKAAKKAEKSAKMYRDLQALPKSSRIKIRVTAGVFEVTLLNIDQEREVVYVIWDDGYRKEFKWGSLVLGPVPDGTVVGQKPTVEVVNPLPPPKVEVKPPIIRRPPAYRPSYYPSALFNSSQQIPYGSSYAAQSLYPNPQATGPSQWAGYHRPYPYPAPIPTRENDPEYAERYAKAAAAISNFVSPGYYNRAVPPSSGPPTSYAAAPSYATAPSYVPNYAPTTGYAPNPNYTPHPSYVPNYPPPPNYAPSYSARYTANYAPTWGTVAAPPPTQVNPALASQPTPHSHASSKPSTFASNPPTD